MFAFVASWWLKVKGATEPVCNDSSCKTEPVAARCFEGGAKPVQSFTELGPHYQLAMFEMLTALGDFTRSKVQGECLRIFVLTFPRGLGISGSAPKVTHTDS